MSKRKCLKEEREEINIDNIEPSAKKAKIKKAKSTKKKKAVKSTDLKIADQNRQIDSDSDLSCDMDSSKKESLAEINIGAWSSMGVPAAVIKALADQNFHSPTMIQAQTLPAAILGRRDILGAAETGSGKTLAFGIPIIKGILDLKSQNDGQNCPVKEIGGNHFFFL